MPKALRYLAEKSICTLEHQMYRYLHRRKKLARSAIKISCKTLSNLMKTIVDLKFSKSGVRRWIVQLQSNRFSLRCDVRNHSFPEWYKSIDSKYGHNLMAWTMYQHIVKGQSFRQIAADFDEVFGLNIEKSSAHIFKSYIMDYYQDTLKKFAERF